MSGKGGVAAFTVEHFDYVRVGERWAVLRLRGRLAADLGAPAGVKLVVGGALDREDLLFPARLCATHPAAIDFPVMGSPHAAELLWRAFFAVPMEVVEYPHSLFRLSAGALALVLPTPGIRIISSQPAQLTPIGARASTQLLRFGPPRFTVAGAGHRIVALATIVALAAASAPVAALAAGGGPRHATRSGRVSVSELGIEHLDRAAVHASGGQASPRRTPPNRTSSKRTPTKRTSTKRTSTKRTSTKRTPHPAVPRVPGVMSITLPATRERKQAERSLGRLRVAHVFSASGVGTSHHSVRPPACAVGFAVLPRGHKDERAASQLAAQIAGEHSSCTKHGPHPPKRGSKHPGKRDRSTGDSVSGGPGHAVGRRTRHRKDTSGGAGVQPLGGLSAHPSHQLSSHSSTPAGSVPTLSSAPDGFTGPSSWTGTVTTNPALTGTLNNLSNLLSNGDRPPQFLIPVYMEAERRYHIPWQVLAAINAVESDYGRDLSTSTAGAIGWMQFEPATWRQYGVAADGHSVANPYDPRDAIFSAAKYLAAAGGRHDIARAVLAYNHAGWYVDEVLARARVIARDVNYKRTSVRRGVISVFFATSAQSHPTTSSRTHPTVRYRGGLLSHYDRLIASANMVSAADFPYVYGGGHEQPARFGPFDCSGSVSYVMQQAGYKVPTTVSGNIPIWKFPTGPGRVTIFYNPTHTFLRIGHRYFGTSGIARPGGGAGWFDADRLPSSYLAQFREVHVPNLHVNSFAAARKSG